MLRVMLESPYRSRHHKIRARNIKYAGDALLNSIDLGEAPFASHLLYTRVLNDHNLAERQRGLAAAYEWMAVADIVAFYVDYGWSEGMIRALKIARLLSKKLEVRRILNLEPFKEPLEVHQLLRSQYRE